MKIAGEVASSGMTYEHMDVIRQFFTLADVGDVVDVTENPESFRDFYKLKKTQPTGLQTFIKEIDSKIGIAPGTTAVLAGWVGSYKSTFGTNIVYNNAKLNYNIVLVSLEVPKEEVMYNLLCRHSFDSKFSEYSFIPHNKIRHCELTEEGRNLCYG